MPEYINHNTYAIHLSGPDGKIIKIKSRERVVLSEYFDKYRTRGFIKLVSDMSVPTQHNRIQAKIDVTKRKIQTRTQMPVQEQLIQDRKRRREEISKARKIVNKKVVTKVVGKTVVNVNPTELFKQNLHVGDYIISNNIGVGILSYNRKTSLQRLINSILANTDLKRTTIFISDDGSTDQGLLSYLDELSNSGNFVVIKNKNRIGIAGNTNRLLRCMARFAYGLILNDDVEIIGRGWDTFYPEAMTRSGMHHLIYRQKGVYGAKIGEDCIIRNVAMRVVKDKPHGAVLAFTNTMLNECGFFDESYGLYGMEHVDWSQKAWEFKLQPSGFYDVVDSDKYFKLHPENSAVENRQALLQNARSLFETRTVVRCEPTIMSTVPEISYVIPFRDIGRTDAIKTVVDNIRGQHFPVIEILLVEQDSESRTNISDFGPVKYYLAKESRKKLFNKSMAFNLAVSNVITERVILHDADIIAHANYTSLIYDILNTNTACHIGNSVMYADKDSSNTINSTSVVSSDVRCERVVGYFEGGSMACHTKVYWDCGGFNEDFWGYGCEDCDFYSRLAAKSIWYEVRTFDFLHLWHGRVPDWNSHHDTNKRIEASLISKSMDERIRLQHLQLDKLGYGRFINVQS